MTSLSTTYNRLGFLSGSTLKILACIFMAFDHVGVIFFPSLAIFRMIGRLAFPLFAYFIAEGCKYTRNKLRRFLTVFIVGALYMLFYWIYEGTLYCNVFITFSISIILIYLLQWAKKLFFNDKKSILALLAIAAIGAVAVATWLLTKIVYLEYGIKGAILAFLISLPDFKGVGAPKLLKKLDNHYVGLICMALGVAFMCIHANLGKIQLFSLLSVVLLMFYNGEPGNRKLKYVFYIFYPAHLLIIEGISILLTLI